MKILLTGSTGFIGRRLHDALLQHHDVVAISTTAHTSETVVNISSRSFANLDEDDKHKVEGVDLILHAGAFTPKSSQQVNDIDGAASNVVFCRNLLQRTFPSVRGIIYLSTIDVYAPAAASIDESVAPNPPTLYGLSKLFGEKACITWAQSLGIPSLVLRVGHVYGPGEEAYSKLIPTLMRKVIAGEAVTLTGDGSERRCFIYIQDIVDAVVEAVNSQWEFPVVNLVGGNPVSVKGIVELAFRVAGIPPRITYHAHPQAARDVIFDNRLARSTFLLRETPVELGVEAELEYFKRQA